MRAREWVKRWEGKCPRCETQTTVAGISQTERAGDSEVGDEGVAICCACGHEPIPMRCAFVGWEDRSERDEA